MPGLGDRTTLDISECFQGKEHVVLYSAEEPGWLAAGGKERWAFVYI